MQPGGFSFDGAVPSRIDIKAFAAGVAVPITAFGFKGSRRSIDRNRMNIKGGREALMTESRIPNPGPLYGSKHSRQLILACST